MARYRVLGERNVTVFTIKQVSVVVISWKEMVELESHVMEKNIKFKMFNCSVSLLVVKMFELFVVKKNKQIGNFRHDYIIILERIDGTILRVEIFG